MQVLSGNRPHVAHFSYLIVNYCKDVFHVRFSIFGLIALKQQEKFTNRGLIRRHLIEKHCETEKAAEIIIKGSFGHLFEDDEM